MSTLPEPFSEMTHFVAEWSVEGSAARAALRGSSTAEQRQAFFTAVCNRLPEALEYLDQKALADLNESEQNLMNLLLSYAHVSLAVEVQGEDEPKLAAWRPKIQLTRTPAGV